MVKDLVLMVMIKPAGEIEVLSWNWGVSQPSGPAGGGSGKGKAIPGDFHFVHLYDKASPVLAKKCVSGTHFKDAKLTARKAGKLHATALRHSIRIGTAKNVTGSVAVTPYSSPLSARVNIHAAKRPINIPLPATASACCITIRNTSILRAPKAMRMPISLVRCATEYEIDP